MAQAPEIPDWGFRFADDLMPELAASVVGYSAQGIEQRIHRGLPSPYLTVVITLDEPVITGWSADEAAGPTATRVDVVTSGLHTGPAYIRQPPAQSGIQLALLPTVARPVLGLPAGELAHATYDGVDVLGAEMGRLRERLIDSPDWTVRLALTQRFLHQRADRSGDRTSLRPELLEAWSWLVRHQGTGRISCLADHVLLSRRQLSALFTAEFGVGPKRFNRLLRFDRVKRMIGERILRRSEVDLAGIAALCGYADQAHLTREFTALAGTSPSRWLAEECGTVLAGGFR